MNDLIRSIIFGVAIAAVVAIGVNDLAGVPAEPAHGIVNGSRCAPVPLKMPCF